MASSLPIPDGPSWEAGLPCDYRYDQVDNINDHWVQSFPVRKRIKRGMNQKEDRDVILKTVTNGHQDPLYEQL